MTDTIPEKRSYLPPDKHGKTRAYTSESAAAGVRWSRTVDPGMEAILNLIDREELKAKLDRGDDFKLVMTLSDWAFQAKHIPGSLNVTKAEDAAALLEKDDEIVIYCSDEACIGSRIAYDQLTKGGYSNVRRYAGGISDWEEHGLPLEGEWA